ncbi:hypothetical protein MTX26_26305 [Bradyrhizobium sp. ISRA443]|uniref:hypothetical protein n=1 Tax=unclassified Bradyrhizobium TaxID=2631580 RepID=UPI00247B0D34|nr:MULTISPECIES: hypothetical protein [unclassified Bradyrhizobium]WGR97855.1 hypothetical protein MTX23_26295 [Bradyrhizobium sp. ISRA436]WGS04745.1 hypothetical protein MTX18_26305 [Bradyrhizobium sp. ISRA437]WGS11626.1 hypothetical protein MTX26_26305 [Bradyrhizobium sp. ISRA443]
MRTKQFARTATAVAAYALLATPSQAIETYDVRDSNGVPFIRARIFGTGDAPYCCENAEPVSSVRNLSQWETDQALAGIQYWAEIIKVVPGQSPAIINIVADHSDNASGFSAYQGVVTKVQAALTGQDPGELDDGAHGVIGIGQMGFSSEPYIPSQVSMTPSTNLPAVVVHEMAHALGMLGDGTNWVSFSKTIDGWTSHWYDDNGKQARPGQTIYCSRCLNPPAADVFDLRRDQGYFGGRHVSEVLAGAMPGVPLRSTSGMSHIELNNSLMSHQKYRNYTNLMEAELAALQDLGYTIDRRNFFGYSLYGSGQTMVNDNPFFSRNAGGTAYLPNTYNTAMLGLGLHVYGSNNTVVQRADLLSRGVGGAGIRVDGGNNSITILPGTRVYADGANGRAVMFIYGKDHTFTQRGDVQAVGNHGIAASFDFGNNVVGNRFEYRGSYIHTARNEPAPILDEINGPLVSTFDLTGRLAGNYAAMYMSNNAYVGQINVMRGAVLSGDIRSDYAQVDANGAPRLTKLTFGMTPDASGYSTGQPDPSFAFRYHGNIVEHNNLSLQLLGGSSFLPDITKCTTRMSRKVQR